MNDSQKARKSKDMKTKPVGDNGALPLTARDYTRWIGELKQRFRATQIKAAVAVNSALIEFYWNLGKDICELEGPSSWGRAQLDKLSLDMRAEFPEVSSFSRQNLYYVRNFYKFYSSLIDGDETDRKGGILRCMSVQQLVEQLVNVPWGHHILIMTKCSGDVPRALFYIRRTIQNGWSRNVLLNWLSSDLYEREGRAQTNFEVTMPSDDCDLARQLVKDPPIGVLVCKEHNRVLAKYHMEEIGLPLGITNYELKKVLPTQAQLAKCYHDAEKQIAQKNHI